MKIFKKTGKRLSNSEHDHAIYYTILLTKGVNRSHIFIANNYSLVLNLKLITKIKNYITVK